MLDEVRGLLGETLQLGARAEALDEQSPLLGTLPELDSMAVVTLIAAIEDRFGIAINDDEISAATFATLGSLTDFVSRKTAA
jgi:acyl carrier protein